MSRSDTPQPSMILLDEYFEAGDDRFLDQVFVCGSPKKLASLAPVWYRDPRPFARRTLLEYVDDGCDRPKHRPLVKSLFKQAEAAGDDEAMGHFMAAFDGLVRRRLVAKQRYDWASSRAVTVQMLRRDGSAPANRHDADAKGRFSVATRQYLARRSFRYFRRLGFRDPERYGRAARAALVLYEDRALDRPERLLDSWGLLHTLYWGSPVIERRPRGVRVAKGRSLAELEPAPIHPRAWEGCFAEVMGLLPAARSRTVRTWAIGLLRARYSQELSRLDAEAVRRLLRSPHPDLQSFGAELLRGARGLENLTVAEWRELMTIDDLDALALVCEMAEKHIAPARLSLADCVEIALAPLAPVAELGLRWLREKPVRTEGDLDAVMGLASAPAPRVRAEGAEWLASLLASSPLARTEHVRDLVDCRHREVRAHALALVASDARFKDDLALAVALSESPYDDVRATLTGRLAHWERELDPGTLRHLWATAMLSVHRGSRVKRTVLERLSERMADHPEEAELLLPILSVALRSVRPAERRGALASIARAAFRAPELSAPIERALPELRLFSPEAAR